MSMLRRTDLSLIKVYLPFSEAAVLARFETLEAYGAYLQERYPNATLAQLLDDDAVELFPQQPWIRIKPALTVAETRMRRKDAQSLFGGEEGEEDEVDMISAMLVRAIHDAGGDMGLFHVPVSLGHKWASWHELTIDDRHELIGELPQADAQRLIGKLGGWTEVTAAELGNSTSPSAS